MIIESILSVWWINHSFIHRMIQNIHAIQKFESIFLDFCCFEKVRCRWGFKCSQIQNCKLDQIHTKKFENCWKDHNYILLSNQLILKFNAQYTKQGCKDCCCRGCCRWKMGLAVKNALVMRLKWDLIWKYCWWWGWGWIKRWWSKWTLDAWWLDNC